MKKLLLTATCILLISLGGYAQQAEQGGSAYPDPDFHLFLLIGQSNMAGRGEDDVESQLANPQILMLNKDREWVVATDPIHFDKKAAGVGPGISFAKQLLDESAKIKIGLIPCAVGGTSIGKWVPGALDEVTGSHPYDDAIIRTHEALKTGVLKGVIWHQGEGNSSPKSIENYIKNVETLIARLRVEFDNPDLPFVAGELGYFGPTRTAFNEMIRELPATVPYTKVVSAEGLDHKGDNLHFNSESARKLGRRYAEAMQDLLDSNP